MNCGLTSEAESELADAASFYRQHFGPLTANNFLATCESKARLITEFLGVGTATSKVRACIRPAGIQALNRPLKAAAAIQTNENYPTQPQWRHSVRLAANSDERYQLGFMITAEGIIARIVNSLAGRVAGAIGGMAPTRRRQSCRYLVKLYYAVQALEEVTGRLLSATEGGRNVGTASVLIQALIRDQDSIEYATNAFIDLARDLQRGLALLDPALHQLCRSLYRGKADFLTCMSFGLRPKFADGKPKVVMSIPNERLLATDFEAAYAQSRKIVTAGGEYYWPPGAFEYLRDCEELDISTESDNSATRAIALIREHHTFLVAAKERLRLLLKDSFTIEELLFHNDETPK